jgi:hypothetical protein
MGRFGQTENQDSAALIDERAESLEDLTTK